MDNFDVCIVGGGPAGYVSALKCAINGLSAAIIEKEKFGGTCLNRGCIPTKAIYSKAKYLSKLKNPEYGFSVDGFSVNYNDIIDYKEKVVSTLVGGVEKLLKARNVRVFNGTGKITGKNNDNSGFVLTSTSEDGLKTEIYANNVIISTGSSPLMIPSFNIDHKNIMTSDEILQVREIPGSLIIIGAGVIGCEFANIFSEFGAGIKMIELLPSILSTEDKDISKFVQKNFKSRNIDIMTSVEVGSIEPIEGNKGAAVYLKTGEKFTADKILVSIGRKLNTDGLGLEELAVKMDKRGKIEVDGHNETAVKGIYACGDIIDGPMLAHKASYDGIIAADNIAGIVKEKDYSVLPWSIYTNPPIGTVGLKEGDKGLDGLDYNVGRFSYAANGMALAMEESEGFLKVIVDKKSKRILGATGSGADIPELIAEITSYMHFGGTVFDIEATIHSHPTLSEIVPESALDSIGEAIHKVNPRTAKKN